MFTDEELEKTIVEFRIAGEDNQDIIKRIHLMFGGEYREKDDLRYNYVEFKLYNGNMDIIYNVSSEAFIFYTPSIQAKIINQWKLKKLIEKMNNVLDKDKEKKMKLKMKKIDKDF